MCSDRVCTTVESVYILEGLCRAVVSQYMLEQTMEDYFVASVKSLMTHSLLCYSLNFSFFQEDV